MGGQGWFGYGGRSETTSLGRYACSGARAAFSTSGMIPVPLRLGGRIFDHSPETDRGAVTNG